MVALLLMADLIVYLPLSVAALMCNVNTASGLALNASPILLPILFRSTTANIQ